MNSKQKGYLTASSIISIVNAGIAFVLGIILLFSAVLYTENDMIELLKENEGYQYEQDDDGGYSIIYKNEDGDLIVVKDEDMKQLILTTTRVQIIEGVVSICFAVSKMVLAILVLIATHKEKYNKGCVIALLVLCCINTNILEIILLIIAMTSKDEPKPEVINENKDLLE